MYSTLGLHQPSSKRLGTTAASRLDTENHNTLLAALSGFVQFTVGVYYPTQREGGYPQRSRVDGNSSALPGHLNGAYAPAKIAMESSEAVHAGANLLSALEEYIKAIVPPQADSCPGASSRGPAQPSIIEDVATKYNQAPDSSNQSIVTASYVASPRRILRYRTQLPSVTMESLRKTVFNDMPIRLLTFDSLGCELELIERNEIVQRCAAMIVQKNGTASSTQKLGINDVTKYAILSHTWLHDTPGELVYRDWSNRHLNSRGYDKVKNFCRVSALQYGYNLAWIDTVCINKDSSTELDESIRSMYKWYRKSSICVAYLAETNTLDEMNRDTWFKRGWTLQELLAPVKIDFYNLNWVNLAKTLSSPIGLAQEYAISEQIESATTITCKELEQFRNGSHDNIPISRRMQLASERQVTREEDTAYSLMGILDVDISIAYGEGRQRAFKRLVRELMISKKYFLDIFNCSFSSFIHPRYRHQNPIGSIPSDIRQFSCRSKAFDLINRAGGTSSRLNKYPPNEPIILTHVGIRVSILLVPGHIENETVWGRRGHANFPPVGDYYGTVSLDLHDRNYVLQKTCYSLLHECIFKQQSGHVVHMGVERQLVRRRIIFFGVLNFRTTEEDILLPNQHCLSIPLDCDAKPGHVTPADPVKIVPTTKATSFELELKFWSRTDTLFCARMIPKKHLPRHGLQLVTKYV